MNPTIHKYLAQHAEPEAKRTSFEPLTRNYTYSLVIPAYNEDVEDIRRVWRNLECDSFLAIIILNAPDQDQVHAISLKQKLTQNAPIQALAPGIEFCQAPDRSTPDLLIIDRFSPGRTIPIQQGVGLARKIGMDIALSIHNIGLIKTHWLYTTDSDAELPSDYFDSDASCEVAEVLPFIHANRTIGSTINSHTAVLLYELQMLYYTAALKWAKSPYAYTSVGSTLRCTSLAYAQVRGVPKRNTGEDFYLLCKLRKLGLIRSATRNPIILSARYSTRVPIGTGRAIESIDALQNPLQAYQYPHPECFAALATFQAFLTQLASTQPRQLNYPRSEIKSFCEKYQFEQRYLSKLSQNPRPAVMQKHLTDWFDGLRTLQFIHHLRDGGLGLRPADQIARCFIVDSVRENLSSTNEIQGKRLDLALLVDDLRRYIFN